jgi:hypothetical protein
MAKAVPSFNVLSSDFTRAMREMSKITGVSFKEIIRNETKSILEAAVKKTKSAQVKTITKGVESRIARTINSKTYLLPGSLYAKKGWKLPDSIWLAVQTQIKNSISRRKQSRGMAKKGWMQAAQSLGISITSPSYVEKSKTIYGDFPQNATGAEKIDGDAFYIEITNNRTYSPSVIDGIRAAMRGRTKFFKENLRFGVFKKTSDIAAKYPGLKAS